jgi:hypothetical protein
MRIAFREKVYLETQKNGVLSHDDLKLLADDFINKDIPREKAEYIRKVRKYIKENTPKGDGEDLNPFNDPTPPPTAKTEGEPQVKTPRTFSEIKKMTEGMEIVTEDLTPDTLSPTGGVEADKLRNMELRVDEFRKSDPIGFIKKAVELGHIDLAKDAIAEDVSIALKGRRDVTPYGVVEGLLTKLSTDHPELIGTGDQVDTNLEALSGMIGQLVRDQGRSDDPRIQSLTQSKFGFNSFDRDDQVDTTAGEIHELINGGLKAGLENTPIEKEYNKLQELLTKLRGNKQ